MKTIQLLEDDLKFASESIQAIATQAIQSIERLYAKRFGDSEDSSNCTAVHHQKQEKSANKRTDIERIDIESARYAGFNLIRDPDVRSSRSTTPPVPPLLKPDQRPDLVDDNLHNLNF